MIQLTFLSKKIVHYIFLVIMAWNFTWIDALSTSSSSSSSLPKLSYRTAKPNDCTNIATLLMETFEGEEIPAWNIVQRKLTLQGYQRQIEKRMEMISSGQQQQNHALIVAVDDGNNNSIAGFMELGTMPPPIVRNTNNDNESDEGDGESEETKIRKVLKEYPFLANLAVDSKYRRQGIGTKLVQLALKVSTKWCSAAIEGNKSDGDDDDDVLAAMYLAVDKDNSAAVQLYDNLDFCRVLDETEQTWVSKKLKQKLKERPPRLYFEKEL